jgi:hypothetical protein
MKYFFIPLIFILNSCSLDKNSTYWNEDFIINPTEDKKLSKTLVVSDDFKTMSFDDFDLFLKEYSKNADYPNINN